MPLRLDERIPEMGFRHPDDALDAFLAWVADSGLTLYPHQEEAILEIFSGRHVILDSPTGSGKSLVATARHFKTFADLGRAWYTAPIKALVSEKFFELCRLFGPEHVGMMTGDATVNRDAPILCCTAEILANLALREGADAKVNSVVMDEFHYYGDRDRGMAWQVPLLTLPQAKFVLMSATLGDTTPIARDLEARTDTPVVTVRGVQRPVPLSFHYALDPVQETIRKLVTGNKAPVYVVHFTQSAATEAAQALMSTDWCSKEEKRAISDALRGFSFHSPFGPTVKRFVQHGIGLHHAGLLPRYRLLVERLAQQGLLKIICGTDTLGVGINVPIRTVLFTQLCKFDGEKVVILPVREFKQIAGRAGRAGYDTAGYVVCQAPAHVIENLKLRDLDPKKAKKAVKAQPPAKGFKHWDEATFQLLIESPPEPLESRFTVDHGRLLSLMQHAEESSGDAAKGYDALIDLIGRAHLTEKRQVELRAEAAKLLATLEGTAVVLREGETLRLDPTLQLDFTLHHSLSLFLLDAIAGLDRASPTYALDVLSLVESILDNPRPVLFAQVAREKTRLMQEMKAAGVPYEERIEKLEDVTWPKPNAEAIYTFFNTYVGTHPWLSGEVIRPKGIVREMAEVWATFAEYVRDLGLQRVEGVLLRYLSEVYQALAKNVPADDRSDEMLDLIAWLRTTIAHVDSSLVTEWETMLSGGDKPVDEVRKPDISSDKRAFAARLRAELHAVVRSLSQGAWEDALAGFRDADGWTPEQLADALAPFFDEHGGIGTHHAARLASATVITSTGPHRWEVQQRLFPPLRASVMGDDPEDDGLDGWAIRGTVDLSDDTNPDGPLITLVAVSP